MKLICGEKKSETRWLRESINGTYSGYVFKIVHSYVVDFPEEALQANIIQELFDYMARNKENVSLKFLFIHAL